MDEFWKKLSERFLLNECSAQERRLAVSALRDGLMDDALKAAIESVMQSEEMARYIDRQGDVPEGILTGLRRMIAEKGASASPERSGDKPAKRSRWPEWLRMAAAVAVAVTVTGVFMLHGDRDADTYFQTITVPPGQTVRVTLADGSSLWLNSQTKLKFPGVFDGAKREVWLEGEGFFDVVTDRRRPFVVHAGKYEVMAHGTKFNVEAYRGDSVFSTSLIEGVVEVIAGDEQPLRLRPRMMAVSNGDMLTADSIRNFDRYRWREGLICFRDAHFREIMNSFEKFYGVRIVIENRKVLTYKCTSKFRLNEGVEYALHVLQRDVQFRFQRDEEAQIIYIR